MSATEASAAHRPRPSLIATLRIVLPVIAGLVLLAVVASTVTGLFHNARIRAAATKPIEMIAPRLIGEDAKQRPFVITAATAQREDGTNTNRIRLNNPVLIRDQDGPDQMRVSAKQGVYDESASKLELTGDVHMTTHNGEFTSPTAIYDSKTGEIIGRGEIQAAASSGQLKAGSVELKDKGDTVTYKGGVHTRLNVK
jgi:lipopolysaccharide export system protein LptC